METRAMNQIQDEDTITPVTGPIVSTNNDGQSSATDRINTDASEGIVSSDDRQLSTIDYLVANGCCIHQARYFVQCFDRPTIEEILRRRSAPLRSENHDQCLSHDRCVAYNTNPDSYKTLHVEADCSCDFVTVNHKEVIDCIEQEQIPLISIQVKEDGPPQLRVQKRQVRQQKFQWRQDYPYVAISHVWADGLGNPCANALPRCQIQQLAETLLDVYGNAEMLFWFDTLCIPADEHATEELKMKAIDTMGVIYNGAVAALVLEAQLMRLSPWDDPLVEISCSVWMRRSWTLQEGVLPSECVFKLGMRQYYVLQEQYDRGFEFGGGSHTWMMHGYLSTRRCVEEQVRTYRDFQHYREIIAPPGTTDVDAPPYRRGKDSTQTGEFTQSLIRHLKRQLCFTAQATPDMSFIAQWNGLAGRSTSMEQDLYFIMANLLGISCQKVLDCPRQRRLEAIVASLPAIPLSLFFRRGARRKDDVPCGNDWIPLKLSSELLGPTTLEKQSRGKLVLDRRNPRMCLVHVIRDPVSPAMEACEVEVVNEPDAGLRRYQVRVLDHEKLTKSRFGAVPLCILLEGQSNEHGTGYRGALFELEKHQTGSWRKQELLVLRYYSAAEIAETSGHEQHQEQQHACLQADAIPGRIRINVLYDPDSIDTQLGTAQGLRWSLSIMEWLNIMMAWFMAIMMALLAIDVLAFLVLFAFWDGDYRLWLLTAALVVLIVAIIWYGQRELRRTTAHPLSRVPNRIDLLQVDRLSSLS